MPRQVRIEYPDAFYHVMARGDRRENIYHDDDDREMFLVTLSEACSKYGWRVHAYVLMGNHYHLLIQTPEPNLVRGMSWLQGTYTSRFNARHKMRGHVFSGRYKAILVQVGEGDYFRTLLDYIHLNPLRAGIAKLEDGLDQFPWSSLSFYRVPPSRRKCWQETELGFDVNDLRDTTTGRRKFLQDLEWRAGLEEAEKAGLTEIEGQGLQATLRRGWYFGNQGFHEKMLILAKVALKKKAKNPNYCGDELKGHGEQRAEEIAEKGLRLSGIKEADLVKMAKGDHRKALVALAIKQETGVSLKWITQRLKMGVTTGISRYASQAKVGLEKNRKQRKLLEKMIK
ncbi:MAG: transposase [Verrucomicrobiales bacterium]|nr:transposase [Verrucomicrobiales bacterium]